MPQATACRSDSGIASMIACRILVSVRTMKMSPSMKTQPRATRHGTPIPRQTV